MPIRAHCDFGSAYFTACVSHRNLPVKSKAISILSGYLLLFFCLLWLNAPVVTPAAAVTQDRPWDLANYVRPWIGSEHGRWYQTVGACRPFGLAEVVPDTEIQSRFGSSGYVYSKTNVFGFAHLHGWGLAAILVMPTQGGVDLARGPDGWFSGHQHANEIMSAGYHKVLLDRYGITAEVTSTIRAGFHRWTFARAGLADMLFDLGAKLPEAEQAEAQVLCVSDTEMEGWVQMRSNYEGESQDVGRVYFVARFNRPFTALHAWQGKDLGEVNSAAGKSLVVYPRFSVKRGEVVTMKIGLSLCNPAQARKNLETEIGDRDFQAIRDESRAQWNEWLSRVQVTGGTEAQRIKFYTDVWHTGFGHQTINDADGAYFDRMSGRIRQLPLKNGRPQHRVFNTDTFWLTQWQLNLWWGMVHPGVLEEWVQDLLLWYDNDPKHRIPWGNVNGAHSWVMMGCPRTPLIGRAIQMGMRGFDAETAYTELKQMHTSPRVGGRGWVDGLDEYLSLGYVSCDAAIIDRSRSASLTCEYAYPDWALAQLALKLGHTNDYTDFMRRSANWTNLWDGQYIRLRHHDGRWADFNPLVGRNRGYAEANAEQYSFFNVQDVPGMAARMGGFDRFAERLQNDFVQAEPRKFAFSEGQFGSEGTVNYANEPCMAEAHLFNYAGRPWLSQYWVRRVHELAYGGTDASGGHAHGDEDQGMMGAVSALMATGLFSVRGGCENPPIYEITSPLFDTVTFLLDTNYYSGKKFVIQTHDNSPANCYIQSARLNGRPLENCWIYQRQFAAGGKLELWLGSKPSTNWGVAIPPWMAH